ncbi:NUDIX domain-containing protein [Ruminococcus sp.]|jgi:8-oxo-dGTP diphosphatase|uniref:NUDIX domain-containing protein n=1 Tax=Ruminococcus sp. TaxID=41978 RepID=UPI0025E22479|nr:NUDIX domain-containing protein [Ruminococcus sp.]
MIAKIIVKCIIYNKKLNRFLLIKRCESDDTGANTWENAGGNIESGETPEEAIKREVREETGITDIRIGNIAYVAILNHELPDLLIVYLCETDEENVRLSFEHSSFVWADEQQCRSLLPSEIIGDFEKNNVFDILRGGNGSPPEHVKVK